MSIFTISKFDMDALEARADYFEKPAFGPATDTLASFYVGGGADALGLSGAPLECHYASLMCGVSPVAVDLLLSEHRQKCIATPGNVVGFSTSIGLHKSLSILYAGLSSADQGSYLNALIKSCTDGFYDVEKAGVFSSRLGRGGAITEQVVVAALVYVHCTNRLLEPHIHLHVEIPNLALCQDGQWRTLDGAKLYKSQAEISRIFDIHLKLNLSSAFPWLSDQLCVDDRGVSLPSIPAEVQDAASSRRKEVAKAFTSGGEKDARDAAVYATRAPKVDIDLNGLTAEWRDEYSTLIDGLRV